MVLRVDHLLDLQLKVLERLLFLTQNRAVIIDIRKDVGNVLVLLLARVLIGILILLVLEALLVNDVDLLGFLSELGFFTHCAVTLLRLITIFGEHCKVTPD